MIVLFTDFGVEGPYMGQMRAVLARLAPGVAVIDLMADAPAFDPMASSYLLASLTPEFPAGTVFLGVVDPGVGGKRPPVVFRAAGKFFAGPGNGLFEMALRREADMPGSGPVEAWEIVWRPDRLTSSFHGRDLFAPIAARLAQGDFSGLAAVKAETIRHPGWPDDLPRILYIDRYGNAITGLRGKTMPDGAIFDAGGQRLSQAVTFSERALGEAFWYVNSNGLVEFAANQARAADVLSLRPGDPVRLVPVK
jgi:S-adenosylmethionine hydrolase